MKNFELPEEVRTGILNYLSTRPYQEVAQAIQLISTLKEIPGQEEDKKDK